MTFPKARPFVFALIFLCWLGYLLFLVLETRKVIISRPQFQIAQAVIVVEVSDDGGKPDPLVAVKEVLWGDQALARQKLRLTDLLVCKKQQGFTGAGDYVIPLMRRGGVWQIAPIPTPISFRRGSHASHGTLEIRDAGPDPNCVLDCFLEFAREKPSESQDLLKPLMPAIATRYLGRKFFDAEIGMFPNLAVFLRPEFAWQDVVDLPRGPLPRLSIEDAHALEEGLKKCGAEVRVNAEEVRIYRWPEMREQVLHCKP